MASGPGVCTQQHRIIPQEHLDKMLFISEETLPKDSDSFGLVLQDPGAGYLNPFGLEEYGQGNDMGLSRLFQGLGYTLHFDKKYDPQFYKIKYGPIENYLLRGARAWPKRYLQDDTKRDKIRQGYFLRAVRNPYAGMFRMFQTPVWDPSFVRMSIDTTSRPVRDPGMFQRPSRDPGTPGRDSPSVRSERDRSFFLWPRHSRDMFLRPTRDPGMILRPTQDPGFLLRAERNQKFLTPVRPNFSFGMFPGSWNVPKTNYGPWIFF